MFYNFVFLLIVNIILIFLSFYVRIAFRIQRIEDIMVKMTGGRFVLGRTLPFPPGWPWVLKTGIRETCVRDRVCLLNFSTFFPLMVKAHLKQFSESRNSFTYSNILPASFFFFFFFSPSDRLSQEDSVQKLIFSFGVNGWLSALIEVFWTFLVCYGYILTRTFSLERRL